MIMLVILPRVRPHPNDYFFFAAICHYTTEGAARQKPNLFGLCRVASEEDESQPNEQRVNVPVPVILQNLYPKHNSRVNIELAADFPARL